MESRPAASRLALAWIRRSPLADEWPHCRSPDGSGLLATNTSRTLDRYSAPLLVHLLFGYFVIFAPLISRPLADAGFQDKVVIGILLLSLFEGAYLGEILRGGVESIPKTQWDSARAVGFSPVQVYRHVIFPQALRRVLPAIAGLFVSLIKDSSLLNVIGVSEYFYNTKNFISRSYAGLEGYIPLALGYLVLTLPVAWLSHWLEKRFRHET